MQKIAWVKIQNFKTLADDKEIGLSHPAVLIGPNNSGKTSVLQALTLWHHGLKRWVNQNKTQGVALNRLEIAQAPVRELRNYFKGASARHGGSKIHISVGIFTENGPKDCTMIFTYQGAEILYAKPDEQTMRDRELLQVAANMDVRILYPMSGIAKEETYLNVMGSIDQLIGQGKTAEVLRNLCYKIIEQDASGQREDWNRAAHLMRQLFQVELEEPRLDTFNGTVELNYRPAPTDKPAKTAPFDIALAGRGQQEMLLLIAYLLTHKNSVLLLDEPDAHLELLRQRQVFSLLLHLADETNSQIIVATHSEIILKETDPSKLVVLIGGDVVALPNLQLLEKTARESLKTFSLEHFYKARTARHVLYVEGSTDIEMLRAFALKLGHAKAKEILEGQLNYYYTTDNFSEALDLDADLARAGGDFKTSEAHFSMMKSVAPDLKAFGVFDGDGKNRQDSIETDKAIAYWKLYELENYFTTPAVIRRFFQAENRPAAEAEAFVRSMLLEIFNGNEAAVREFENLAAPGSELEKETFKNSISTRKASTLLEKAFAEHARQTGLPLLLRKSEFYKLIEHLPTTEVAPEIREKLDLLAKYLV